MSKLLGVFPDAHWRHNKFSSPCKPTTSPAINRRNNKRESYALLRTWSDTSVSLDFDKAILSQFRADDISEVCKRDILIIHLGALLFEKFSAHQHEYIRQTMRQIGRLVLEIKRLESTIVEVKDLLLPKNFDTLIKAVRKLCLSSINDVRAQNFKIPSMALKLGHSLRKCAQIARGFALRKGDLKTLIKGFMDIMDIEWRNKVSSIAVRSLLERKINSTEMLPITDDILKLNAYLDSYITIYSGNLDAGYDIPHYWAKLGAVVLYRIILFNKRRSGEAARMTLQHYACRPEWKTQCTTEVKDSLSSLEERIADRLTVVEVHGKSRKHFKVPILLTAETKAAVDKLIEFQELAGIDPKNNFVFARGNGSLCSLRGHECLKQFAKSAELVKPECITSTKLRKYIATVTQVINLKDHETDWLARHLGHDIRIHRDFYRLHESAIELTKVSRILLAVDSGKTASFYGKNLEDICLDGKFNFCNM